MQAGTQEVSQGGQTSAPNYSSPHKRKPWRSSGLLQTRSGGLLLAKRMRGEQLTTRESLYLLMNEPSTSRAAFYVGRSLQSLLVLSTIASTWETVTSVTSSTGAGIWVGLKVLFNIIFTIEMSVRLASYVPFSSAPSDAYVWLDILQVLGFWVRTTRDGVVCLCLLGISSPTRALLSTDARLVL